MKPHPAPVVYYRLVSHHIRISQYNLTDVYLRLQQACMKKCVPREYREGEINKGEGVCIDRCAAKFFDVQLKVSELLQAEAAAKGAGGGGMGFGGM
jgi:mitochondrial import inner membrane translocase subunit TIM10